MFHIDGSIQPTCATVEVAPSFCLRRGTGHFRFPSAVSALLRDNTIPRKSEEPATLCGGDHEELSYSPQKVANPSKPYSVRFYLSVVEFLSKIGGRDKLARTTQYLLKVIIPAIENLHPDGLKNDITPRLNNIATGLGHGRRFIRIGNLPALLRDILSTAADKLPFIRVFSTASKSCSLAFLFVDHTEWVSRCGVFKMQYEYWAWWGAFFWFMGACLGALCNLYLISRARGLIISAAMKARQAASSDDQKKISKDISDARDLIMKQQIDLARNLCDAIMASNGVRKMNSVPQWIFSLFGCMSSVIGSYQTWPALE